jgi:ABC-2 type transport system permease protein
MKTVLYPFSQLGYACEGNGLALLLYALMFTGVFACAYFLVSVTYLRLATANKGNRKVKYTGKGYKENRAIVAMIKKELSRYTKNGMVLLNSFMGTVFYIALPFVALFKRGDFLQLAQGFQGEFALLLAGILCVLAFSNFFAPSCISMEGESLDVIRVLPIRTERIFLAKGLANGVITGIPALLSSICTCIILKQSFLLSVCVVLAVTVCVAFASAGGIAVNLLLPNLKWTNEVAVIKQSMSTLVSMLGGMGAMALLVGGYFLFGKYLPAWGFLLICTAILLVASGCICGFLKKKGARIFEEL